jgi:hypothetical protein
LKFQTIWHGWSTFQVLPHFGKIKEMKKALKIEILVHEALLCALVSGKNHKLAIPQVLKKTFTKWTI